MGDKTVIEKQLNKSKLIINFLDNSKKSSSADTRSLIWLANRKKLLLDYWKEFRTADEDIQCMPEFEESDYANNRTYDVAECSYLAALCWLDEETAKITPVLPAGTILQNTSTSSTSTVQNPIIQ